MGKPYLAELSESTNINTLIATIPPIETLDRDEGKNAETTFKCFENSSEDIEVCKTFLVSTEKISDGRYYARITLTNKLDYEKKSSYILKVIAKDGSKENPLTSLAEVLINVLDVQDQVSFHTLNKTVCIKTIINIIATSFRKSTILNYCSRKQSSRGYGFKC